MAPAIVARTNGATRLVPAQAHRHPPRARIARRRAGHSPAPRHRGHCTLLHQVSVNIGIVFASMGRHGRLFRAIEDWTCVESRSAARIWYGAPGTTCSAGSTPVSTRRRIRWFVTPSAFAASVMVSQAPSFSAGSGRHGVRARAEPKRHDAPSRSFPVRSACPFDWATRRHVRRTSVPPCSASPPAHPRWSRDRVRPSGVCAASIPSAGHLANGSSARPRAPHRRRRRQYQQPTYVIVADARASSHRVHSRPPRDCPPDW